MRFAFQLENGIEVEELASYENGVANRQAHEKEKAAKLRLDTEMRVTELTVRGVKRKAFRKETTEEKADKSRLAKRALIDSLWKAGARKETAEAASRMESRNCKQKRRKSLVPKSQIYHQTKFNCQRTGTHM